MDMLDPALDSSEQQKESDENETVTVQELVHDDDGEGTEEQHAAIANINQATLTLDPSAVQYQYRADGGQGQITYRVVQVQGDDPQAQVVTTSAFPAGTQIAQAVIQSPFSNGGSPTPEGQGDTRFTYIPAVSGAAGDAISTTTDVQGTATLGQVATAGGQFYVMMSPQDVLQGQRNIAPRTAFQPKLEGVRSSRDERRRSTHNEVERRRRDKINNWIVQLSKLVPDCAQDHAKQSQSKGGILSKACDYINELRTANVRMAETLKETERLSVDHELLRQQVDELKQENAVLRAQLQQHGLLSSDLSANST